MEEILNHPEFSDIAPYSDEQAVAAIKELVKSPGISVLSKYLMPKEPADTFQRLVGGINTIDEFQFVVMGKIVAAILERSSAGLEYDGLENIPAGKRFLAVSNHRDIVMDPAILQYVMLTNNLPFTELCVGDNLLANPVAATLLRCNRMIKVIRGISARELYLSSKVLSSYIRHSITSGHSSVWIAQREGRTKNGRDITEQGLLKMFDMSGEGSFEENFKALNIIPMSISYEYEPCDIKKAREILISREQKYVKRENEDLHSILTGIRQYKGHICFHIGKPLSDETIHNASLCDKNDRYQSIRHAVDRAVIEGYKLWKTNYMAYDLFHGGSKYASKYSSNDMKDFQQYIVHKMGRVERSLDQEALREIFLEIYAGPVESKESL